MLDRIANDFRRWRSYRRTVSALSALSARELDDLGIAPYQISDIARGNARR